MKASAFFTRFAMMLMLLAITAPELSAHHPAHQNGRWERLGQRTVNYAPDRDVIHVGASEGTFKALQIKVKGAPIDLMQVVVFYRNGQKQVLNVSQTIPRGGKSRVLDLPGNNRVITKVSFLYDTRNRARRRATVELWGRH